MFRDNSKSTMNPFPETFKEKALMAWYTVQWMIAGSGPFSSNVSIIRVCYSRITNQSI